MFIFNTHFVYGRICDVSSVTVGRGERVNAPTLEAGDNNIAIIVDGLKLSVIVLCHTIVFSEKLMD